MLHTSKKNHVFPKGVLWDKKKQCYRTDEMNVEIVEFKSMSVFYNSGKE